MAGTLDFGLHFTKAPRTARFVGYCDSDLAGDIDTSESTSGTLFFLGNCLVSLQSIKQKVVALSSCEAEYIAAASAACQGVWLSRLIADLTGEKLKSFRLLMDSKSAIELSKNPVHHERSKHIDTRYHYIRECVANGIAEVDHISTDRQLADILTKPLGRIKFVEMRQQLGVRDVCHD